jgi:hypothetical protein
VGKRRLGIPRRRWEDNSKMNIFSIFDSILTFKKTHGISRVKHTDVPIAATTRSDMWISAARLLVLRA